MSQLLSIDVNSVTKAKRICEARKGFYEVLYDDKGKKIYTVFYKTQEVAK